MYEGFIRSAFMKDLLYNLFFLIWIPVIYFGFQLYKEESRGCALTFLIMFFGGAALVDFSTKWAYYADYVNYIRQGDNYVMEKTCVVESIDASLSTAIVYGHQNLECSDGTHVELRYRRDYQRIYPKVGRAFRVRYLPKSGMVVELEPLDDAEPPVDSGGS